MTADKPAADGGEQEINNEGNLEELEQAKASEEGADAVEVAAEVEEVEVRDSAAVESEPDTDAEPEATQTQAEAKPEVVEALKESGKGKDSGSKEKDSGKDAKKEDPPGAHLDPIVLEGSKKHVETEEELAARYAIEAGETDAEIVVEDDVPEEPELKVKPVKIDRTAVYRATGKRKQSIARVILKAGKGEIVVNGRTLEEFFPRKTLQQAVFLPLQIAGVQEKMSVTVRVHGGGVSGQAQAVRHGIAKALVEADVEVRGPLKRKGLLTRDSRVKERRKAGFKKARKRPQFSKR